MRVSAIISLLSLTVLQAHCLSLLHPPNPFFHHQPPVISDSCFGTSHPSLPVHEKVKSCMPLVVRPADLPKPTIEPPQKVVDALGAAASAVAAIAPAIPVPVLPPIGGPCSCKAALVKPAVVPKPAPFTHQIGSQQVITQQHTCNSHCLNNGITSTITNSIPLVPSENGITGVNTAAGCNGVNIANMISQHQITNYRRNPANIAPADAVSLTLAFNQAKKHCGKSEGQLAFGFRQLPKELPQSHRYYTLGGGRRKALIPEGNLFDLNGEVVELKPVKCEHTKSLDEEAVEELLDLAMEEQEEAIDTHLPLKTVSLGELGYVPAKKNSPVFIDIPAKPIESAVNAAVDAVAGAIQGCKDGFKPGEVVMAEIPKMQPILSPPPYPLPEPCDDSLEDRMVPVRPAVAVPVSGSYAGGFHTASASSCASASQAHHHSFTTGY